MRALLFLMFIGMVSCTSSKDTVAKTKKAPTEQSIASAGRVDLTDELRKLNGVIVRGSGASATFQVRGVNSINSGTEPLFVLDGQAVQGYATIYDMVNANNFKSARLLKEGESTLYGVRGANGVIVIKTKK